MSKTIEAKRTVTLLALAMAALMVVLSAVAAPDAEAKKKRKKHHRPPPINVVQCPNSGSQGCVGTAGPDHLVGTDAFDRIEGGEGGDIYEGKGGSDVWSDTSTTSNDRFLLPATEFNRAGGGPIFIEDRGGSFDVLDLSPYKFGGEYFEKNAGNVAGDSGDDLLLERFSNDNRDIIIVDFLSDENSIDFFKFSDTLLTAEEMKA